MIAATTTTTTSVATGATGATATATATSSATATATTTAIIYLCCYHSHYSLSVPDSPDLFSCMRRSSYIAGFLWLPQIGRPLRFRT